MTSTPVTDDDGARRITIALDTVLSALCLAYVCTKQSLSCNETVKAGGGRGEGS